MSRIRKRGEQIRRFILENVEITPDVSRVTAEKFEITRQAVNKHLQRLVSEGCLTEQGKTKNRTYKLASLVEWQEVYSLADKKRLEEDVVWRNDVQPILGNLPENVLGIWNYGLTEAVNNAIDHSGGSSIYVKVSRTAVDTEILLSDNGVGIFKKIQADLGLLDERHAVMELSKGKLTTDPEHHTGEGIFFSSRMFDKFDILSGGVFFTHEFGGDDWIMENSKTHSGTYVWMKLYNHTARTTKQVFDQYASPEGDYRFDKTIVPVRLAQYGNDMLVSRSQAKRLLSRIELFKTVIFDFTEVESVGQAFADEIFRVFAKQHPDIHLLANNANHEVLQMVGRALERSNGAG